MAAEQHLRFNLRWLLVAVTSCAVAFAVIRADPQSCWALLAWCVPGFWAGISAIFAGYALTLSSRAFVESCGALVISMGFAVAGTAALLGSVALLSCAVEVSRTVAW